MSDISMCVNQTCKARETCYRFKATPCDYQLYGDFGPSETDKGLVEGSCSYYWEVVERDDEINT